MRPLVILALLLLSACAENPVTHQKELVLVSEAQEIAEGRELHPKVIAHFGLYRDEALQAYVQEIGTKLAAHSHRPELIYRFTVLDSPETNAFSLPGGYIYVMRGLLAYLNSEAELAAVLGHEIGHVAARHSVRQQTMATAASLGYALGSILFPELRTQVAQNIYDILGTAVIRGYGRKMELEADHLAAQYMAKVGYDPHAILEVLRTLKALDDFE
ncbi:MAG: peptidase, partial [Gammaproteobacteria bacterium]